MSVVICLKEDFYTQTLMNIENKTKIMSFLHKILQFMHQCTSMRYSSNIIYSSVMQNNKKRV